MPRSIPGVVLNDPDCPEYLKGLSGKEVILKLALFIAEELSSGRVEGGRPKTRGKLSKKVDALYYRAACRSPTAPFYPDLARQWWDGGFANAHSEEGMRILISRHFPDHPLPQTLNPEP